MSVQTSHSVICIPAHQSFALWPKSIAADCTSFQLHHRSWIQSTAILNSLCVSPLGLWAVHNPVSSSLCCLYVLGLFLVDLLASLCIKFTCESLEMPIIFDSWLKMMLISLCPVMFLRKITYCLMQPNLSCMESSCLSDINKFWSRLINTTWNRGNPVIYKHAQSLMLTEHERHTKERSLRNMTWFFTPP